VLFDSFVVSSLLFFSSSLFCSHFVFGFLFERFAYDAEIAGLHYALINIVEGLQVIHSSSSLFSSSSSFNPPHSPPPHRRLLLFVCLFDVYIIYSIFIVLIVCMIAAHC
jgi:hypothetical protein